jgi:hypothetical protein
MFVLVLVPILKSTSNPPAINARRPIAGTFKYMINTPKAMINAMKKPKYLVGKIKATKEERNITTLMMTNFINWCGCCKKRRKIDDILPFPFFEFKICW